MKHLLAVPAIADVAPKVLRGLLTGGIARDLGLVEKGLSQRRKGHKGLQDKPCHLSSCPLCSL